jgi:hypothetical protein
MAGACRITVEDVSKLGPAARDALDAARVELPKLKLDARTEGELEEIIRKLPRVDRANLKYVVRALDHIIQTQEEIREIRG